MITVRHKRQIAYQTLPNPVNIPYAISALNGEKQILHTTPVVMISNPPSTTFDDIGRLRSREDEFESTKSLRTQLTFSPTAYAMLCV